MIDTITANTKQIQCKKNLKETLAYLTSNARKFQLVIFRSSLSKKVVEKMIPWDIKISLELPVLNARYR